jgi:hypothetical protein
MQDAAMQEAAMQEAAMQDAAMQEAATSPFTSLPMDLQSRVLSAAAEAHFRRQPPPRGPPPVTEADACSPAARRRVLEAVGLNRRMAGVARLTRGLASQAKTLNPDPLGPSHGLLALVRRRVFEENGDSSEMLRYLADFDEYVGRGCSTSEAAPTPLFNRLSSFRELVRAWSKMFLPYKFNFVGHLESSVFFVDGYELLVKGWGRRFPSVFSRLGAFELAFRPNPLAKGVLEMEGRNYRPEKYRYPRAYLTASQSAALSVSVRYEYDSATDRLVYTPFSLPEPNAIELEVLAYRDAILASDTSDIDEKLLGSMYAPLRELPYHVFVLWREGNLPLYDYNA